MPGPSLVAKGHPCGAYVISSGNPSKPIKASLLQLPSGVLPLKLKKKENKNRATQEEQDTQMERSQRKHVGKGWTSDSEANTTASVGMRTLGKAWEVHLPGEKKTKNTQKKKRNITRLRTRPGRWRWRPSRVWARRAKTFRFLQGLGELSESARKVTAPRFLDMLFWLYLFSFFSFFLRGEFR